MVTLGMYIKNSKRMKLGKLIISIFSLFLFNYLYAQDTSRTKLFLCDEIVNNNKIKHIVIITKCDTLIFNDAKINGYLEFDCANNDQFDIYFLIKKNKNYVLNLKGSSKFGYVNLSQICFEKSKFYKKKPLISISFGGRSLTFIEDRIKYSKIKIIYTKFGI